MDSENNEVLAATARAFATLLGVLDGQSQTKSITDAFMRTLSWQTAETQSDSDLCALIIAAVSAQSDNVP